MKRKWIFVLSVVLQSLLVLISVCLANQCDVATQEFNYAGCAFFLSIFFIFNCKDAKKPSKSWGAYNSVKVSFESRGKLHRYKYRAYAELTLAMIVGFLCLIAAFLKILMR